MNPNSISHRLFVAALVSGGQIPPKRPAIRAAKNPAKSSAAKIAPSVSATAQKLSEWSWSGWQHTTI